MQEDKVDAYTFAITGYPLPPFITRKRKQLAKTLRDELEGFEGLIGITLYGRVMLLHMMTENDATRAKNRLLYCGFGVSDETYPTLLDMNTKSVQYADEEEEDQ